METCSVFGRPGIFWSAEIRTSPSSARDSFPTIVLARFHKLLPLATPFFTMRGAAPDATKRKYRYTCVLQVACSTCSFRMRDSRASRSPEDLPSLPTSRNFKKAGELDPFPPRLLIAMAARRLTMGLSRSMVPLTPGNRRRDSQRSLGKGRSVLSSFALGMLVALALAGCVGGDTPPETGDTNTPPGKIVPPLNYVECLGSDEYLLQTPVNWRTATGCCWQRELGCKGPQNRATCGALTADVRLRTRKPMELIVSWGLPQQAAALEDLAGFSVALYVVDDAYQSAPPYRETSVAPCTVWYTHVHGMPGMQEVGKVEYVTMLDHGVGVSAGTMEVDSDVHPTPAFAADFEVCRVRTTESVENAQTGYAYEVCNVDITNTGRLYVDDADLTVSSGTTPAISAKARAYMAFDYGTTPCAASDCRPALGVTGAGQVWGGDAFRTANGTAFPGVLKGRTYAAAVISNSSTTGWGTLPEFGTFLKNTFHPGQWAHAVALGLPSEPRDVAARSVSRGPPIPHGPAASRGAACRGASAHTSATDQTRPAPR